MPEDAAPLISLTFHKVSPLSKAGDIYTQSPERLRRVIELALESKAEFTTWEKLDEGGGETPAWPMALSFDDSFESDYSQALPILQEFGIEAAFFIVPRRVGRGNFLTWTQVREMAEAGMLIGSHSLSHTPLTQLPTEVLREELATSRQEIEEQIQRPVRALSFPSGYYNRRVAREALGAGYEYLAGSEYGVDRIGPGRALKGRVLRRNCIEARVSPAEVEAILRGQVPLSLRLVTRAKRRIASVIGVRRYEALSNSRMSF